MKSNFDGVGFSQVSDTFIIAFCPDTASWFATNQRMFFYEYLQEFESEKDAIDYFVNHLAMFYKEEIDMGFPRPSAYAGKVFMENNKTLYDVPNNKR